MIDLKDRYDNIMSLINKACFLNPRFKALVFMSDSDKSCTIASVKEAQMQNDDSTSSNTSTSTVNLSDDDDAPSSPG